MKISYYNPDEHQGTQPIRVLYQNLKFWYKNSYPNFRNSELSTAITNKGLVEEINYRHGENCISNPGYVIFNSICIEETFAAYLWSLSYSLVVLYDEAITRPRIEMGYVFSTKAKTLIADANALKDYAFSLLSEFSKWNLELPNPEYYDSFENSYIEKVNGVYLHAISFVLLHELGHVVLDHNDESTSSTDDITKEFEADEYSINTMLKGKLTNTPTLMAGIVAGFSSLIFFNSKMRGGTHPDPDERLKIALERLNLPDIDNLWGMACLAIRLWCDYYKVTIDWPKDNQMETYKEMFYFLINKIEIIKKG